jgi:PleD family two-component response regulator
VLDLVLPDMDGLYLVETIRRDSSRSPAGHRAHRQGRHARRRSEAAQLVESFILKGPESHQQLFDETALFMHRQVAAWRTTSAASSSPRAAAKRASPGRRVLIVDDDIRNIFSLTGVLEQHQVQVVHAESGARASSSWRRAETSTWC